MNKTPRTDDVLDWAESLYGKEEIARIPKWMLDHCRSLELEAIYWKGVCRGARFELHEGGRISDKEYVELCADTNSRDFIDRIDATEELLSQAQHKLANIESNIATFMIKDCSHPEPFEKLVELGMNECPICLKASLEQLKHDFRKTLESGEYVGSLDEIAELKAELNQKQNQIDDLVRWLEINIEAAMRMEEELAPDQKEDNI